MAVTVVVGYLFWRGSVRREHTHVPAIVVIADPFVALVACISTRVWWRARRRGR